MAFCVLKVFCLNLGQELFGICCFCCCLCFEIFRLNGPLPLAKALIRVQVDVPSRAIVVRSCTSWKKDSPHNREFEKTDLPHDRGLQSNDSPHHLEFQSCLELEDDSHQVVFCEPACLVSFPDQLEADREPYALEGLPPPPRVAFTC